VKKEKEAEVPKVKKDKEAEVPKVKKDKAPSNQLGFSVPTKVEPRELREPREPRKTRASTSRENTK